MNLPRILRRGLVTTACLVAAAVPAQAQDGDAGGFPAPAEIWVKPLAVYDPGLAWSSNLRSTFLERGLDLELWGPGFAAGGRWEVPFDMRGPFGGRARFLIGGETIGTYARGGDAHGTSTSEHVRTVLGHFGTLATAAYRVAHSGGLFGMQLEAGAGLMYTHVDLTFRYHDGTFPQSSFRHSAATRRLQPTARLGLAIGLDFSRSLAATDRLPNAERGPGFRGVWLTGDVWLLPTTSLRFHGTSATAAHYGPAFYTFGFSLRFAF